MKIVEINYTDLPGRIFDGYDLHIELNKKGFEASQIVVDKKSDSETVKGVPINNLPYTMITEFEKMYGIENMLIPTAAQIEVMPEYIDADIVHFHILHNDMISLFDYPRLMNKKRSVWTIHDPWITTGGCIHALDCKGREEGCRSCNIYKNAGFMYGQKKKYIGEVNPLVIVSTEWMKKQLENSPITSHFDHIEVIPFGVNVEDYEIDKKNIFRSEFEIKEDQYVIGFRLDDNPLKGCEYIFKALRQIHNLSIIIMSVGAGTMPDDIRQMYRVIELGWQDDKDTMNKFFVSCDIFIMPSMAESFGLMSVEAMAAETVVVCFKDTVVEEIVNAPDIGYAAEYCSYESLREIILYLINNPEVLTRRKILCRKWVDDNYLFNDYYRKHIELYESLI